MSVILNTIESPADLKSLNQVQLEQLCRELRDYITQVVEINGGHLASSLGVVELTVALHRVFDTPKDKIIWDVGHQSYAHKILTGRREQFKTLRTYDGISGFPRRSESPYDAFDVGHSSTSISLALGMARSRDLLKEDYRVVAVIGDGSIGGGMSWEAINDAGRSGTSMIIVLNDNEMSIDHNVGALSQYLSKIRVRSSYDRLKKLMHRLFKGANIEMFLERIKNSLKYLVVHGVLFEEMGIKYIGPINGHDMVQLSQALELCKKYEGTVLLHVHTTKGKGHAEAEASPEQYHGVPAKAKKAYVSFPSVFGDALLQEMKCNGRVVAITAAMPDGCGLKKIKKNFTERFFDVGIAEQHAVGMAAGMAAEGMRPVVAVYSTFLQRAYDQVLHDICNPKMPVVLVVVNSGIAGEDGATHQGVFGLSFLGNLPGLDIFYPSNTAELREMLRQSLEGDKPVAICLQRGAAVDGVLQGDIRGWQMACSTPGARVALLAVGGNMLAQACKAAVMLSNRGIKADVVNCRLVKPLDDAFLADIERYDLVLTVEENMLEGGFGHRVLSHVQGRTTVKCVGVDDHFIPHGKVRELMKREGLTAEAIAAAVCGALGNETSGFAFG